MRRPVLEVLRDRYLVPSVILVMSLQQGTNGDISEVAWMAREGADLLAGSPLIHPDRWSWAPQSWDFVPTSPAWQYLSAWVWTQFGIYGPHLLASLVSAICLAAVARIAVTLGAKPTPVVISLAFVFLVCGGVLTARAGLPAFALFIATLAILGWLVDAKAHWSTLRVLGAVLTMDLVVAYLGIWLHQSWATFAPALAVLQVPILWRFLKQRNAVRWVVLLGPLATIVGVLAGPIGARVWPQTVEVAAACRGLVKEWKTPWQIGPVWIGIWLVCLGLLALLIRHSYRNRPRTTPLHVVLLIVSATAVLAGATAVRFIILGAYAMAPLLAVMWSNRTHSSRWPGVQAKLGERLTEPYWRNVVALLMIPLIPLATFEAATTNYAPDRAFSALPANCRAFASDTTSKFIELYRPDVQVWVDGRQHYWGRERLMLGMRYMNGRAELVPPGTTCVMLQKKQAPRLRRGLAADPTWSLTLRSKRYEVWARN